MLDDNNTQNNNNNINNNNTNKRTLEFTIPTSNKSIKVSIESPNDLDLNILTKINVDKKWNDETVYQMVKHLHSIGFDYHYMSAGYGIARAICIKNDVKLFNDLVFDYLIDHDDEVHKIYMVICLNNSLDVLKEFFKRGFGEQLGNDAIFEGDPLKWVCYHCNSQIVAFIVDKFNADFYHNKDGIDLIPAAFRYGNFELARYFYQKKYYPKNQNLYLETANKFIKASVNLKSNQNATNEDILDELVKFSGQCKEIIKKNHWCCCDGCQACQEQCSCDEYCGCETYLSEDLPDPLNCINCCLCLRR